MTIEETPGAEFEAVVQGLASDGRGVVIHPSGRRFFVAGVCLGERLRLKITQLKGRTGFADCLAVLEASEQRQASFCQHQGFSQGKCGGCPWQFMDYDEQLRQKQARVEREFERLDAKLAVQPIWPSEKIRGYRNRAQLKTDGRQIGYLSFASNDLAAIADCPILSEKNRRTLAELIAMLPNPDWQPDPRSLRKNQWTSLDIDEDVDANTVSVNQRLAFRQANDAQNQKMKDWLNAKLSSFDKQQKIVELFCGSGNFTEVIAAQGFAEIHALEGVDSAIKILKAKALPGVTARTANLFSADVLAQIFSAKNSPNILVLDPPREGLKEREPILPKKSAIKDVFYVSCDLATLARDVAFFLEHKFKIKEIQPLDQFPHTPHIELLVHLSRTKN